MLTTTFALALAARGRVDEAIAHYRKALEVEPDNAEAHNNPGAALASRGKFDDAIGHYRRALEIEPGNAYAHYNLGFVLAGRGRIEEAIAHYRKAPRLQARLPQGVERTGLAAARTCPDATFRDGAAAIELAQRAIELPQGKTPEILDTLAAAYAETGMFSKATKAVGEALELARQQNKPVLVEKLKARLWDYETGVPYRQPRQSSGH